MSSFKLSLIISVVVGTLCFLTSCTPSTSSTTDYSPENKNAVPITEDTYLEATHLEDTIPLLSPLPIESSFTYHNEVAVSEPTLKCVSSTNGLVTIDKKSSYYDVALDFESGSHYDVGKAYGEAILEIYPSFATIMEPYIYENIYMAFPDLEEDFTPITARLEAIMPTIDKDYQEEIKGLADSLATDTKGFIMDEKLSQEEVYLLQFIPDILRGTQCSGLSVYGKTSKTGAPITIRLLEWPMGNASQMAYGHAVVHFKNGDKSLTSYGVLGLLQAISIQNDKGVFAGILDSNTEMPFNIKGKTSYTFALRYALENYDSAKAVGDYITSLGKQFTFSHNILLTDTTSSYVAENCVGDVGICALRSADSTLSPSLEWDIPDSICVVNGFALNENYDNMTRTTHNMIRHKKFNTRLASYPQVDANDLKDIVTVDAPTHFGSNIYSNYAYQIIVIDSFNHTVDIAFAPPSKDLPAKPTFTRIAN